MKSTALFALLVLASLTCTACGDDAVQVDQQEPLPEEQYSEDEELPVGDVDDLKADGAWGSALTCKAIPDLEPLKRPEIVVSLDGLTLRLRDAEGDFDKVYPIGPGKIEGGKSLTPTSLGRPGQVYYLRMDQKTVQETSNPNKAVFGMNYSCKIWWPDPDKGKKIPVFAGLPFIRLEGAPTLGYAIHGPIDSYTIPSGGKLTRGFVSHGCIRMEAADVVELFALTQGSKVPVRIQQSVERDALGKAVDIPQRWLLSECTKDEECNFPGGFCKMNEYGSAGFCTAACTKYCSLDKFGYPTSFCVADPEDDASGICILKSTATNNSCRRFPGFELWAGTPRFSDPSVKADVCLPGSSGWVGAPCFSDLDCALSGGNCHEADLGEGRPGFCTVSCSKYCSDLAGFPTTFCVDAGSGSGECVQKCVLQDDCPAGYACTPDVPRFGQSTPTSSVCM